MITMRSVSHRLITSHPSQTGTGGKGGGGYLWAGTLTGSLTAPAGKSAGQGFGGIAVGLNTHEYRDLTIPAGQQKAEVDQP